MTNPSPTSELPAGRSHSVRPRSEVSNQGNPLAVVHFHRKPCQGHHSIEGLFETIRQGLRRHGCQVEKQVMPWPSSGILNRIRSMLWARRHQSEVNHITGDVHFLALLLDTNRTILTIHDLEMVSRATGIKRRLLKLFWFTLPLKKVQWVTVISEATRTALLAECRFPADRVVVIPNAVRTDFQPSPPKPLGERPTILQIGVKTQKNLLRLIESLSGLAVHLHIIGRLLPEQREALSRYSIDYRNSVDLTDEQIYQAYCDADLVTLVSTEEGFGMPILEAQWVERPVVTSNCSSMPEVAGQGACLVDPFDVSSIRQGVCRVLNDAAYRDDLVEQGRKNRQRFTVDAVAEQYLNLYRMICPDCNAAATAPQTGNIEGPLQT